MSIGLGVLINEMDGSNNTKETLQKSIGKKIETIVLNEEDLRLGFDDGDKVMIWDDGQSCCEHRYMRTDDDLNDFVGAIIRDYEVADVSHGDEQNCDVHEIQFFRIHTDKGIATFACHNEHNGYYGGFSIRAV